jgi:uncharacterized protein YbaP (TraB family)
VVAVLLATPCAWAGAEEATPLLWKATDESGHILYLFGTIHVAEESLYPLPYAVMTAYEESDALALELDITTAALEMMMLPEYAQIMYLPQGDSIENHLSAETLALAESYLSEAGYPAGMLRGYSAMGWYSLLDGEMMAASALKADLGVDMHLANMAKEQGKTLLEVESVELQLAMLGGFSDELYDMMILSMVQSADLYARQLGIMYTAWKMGNEAMINFLCNTSTEGLSEAEAALMEEYNAKMLSERNIAMAEFARTQLLSGDTVFMAVGTAHMVGEDGIVSLLREMGYTVEKIEY